MSSKKSNLSKRHRRSQKRADARKNIETILAAAEYCLVRNPDASMMQIAKEAGLGRMTLYGHFASRPQLLEVVARRVLGDANKILSNVDLSGSKDEGLKRLVEATWQVTIRSGNLVEAVEKALPPETIRKLHAGELENRVRNFLSSGQKAGTFRTDLNVEWLVTTFHSVLHAAVLEIAAGRLQKDSAAQVIFRTLRSAYRAD